MATREVVGVPLGESRFPIIQAADFGEGFAESEVLWVEGGVFDAEFAHLGTGSLFAVEFHCQTKVFQDDFPLLVE